MTRRSEEKLNQIRASLIGDISVTVSNITDMSSLEELSGKLIEWSPKIDLIINASGCDVRKSLVDHNYDEIAKSIEVNLLGAILITKVLISNLKDEKGSTIIHIGGFADGRMAFPYYSVDVATRAGIYSFIESFNRELETEGKKIRVTYFCPSPTETEAERPYHKLWRDMGIKIVPIEKVAEELIRTYEKKRSIGIMGGKITNLFAKLNSVMPKLADRIVMIKYGKMIKEYLYTATKQTITMKMSLQKKKSRGILYISLLSYLSFFHVCFMLSHLYPHLCPCRQLEKRQ